MGERNEKKQENEVSRMNLLAKIMNYFSEEVEEADTDLKEVKEINLDWKEVALDLN